MKSLSAKKAVDDISELVGAEISENHLFLESTNQPHLSLLTVIRRSAEGVTNTSLRRRAGRWLIDC
jgi:hypothetical protein